MKKEAVADVDGHAQIAQRMVDQIFSYGELGFQEIETNRYLIDILKTNGFSVQEGVAGIPDRVRGDVGIRQAGDRARAPTSTASRRRRRSRAWPTTSR